MVRSIADPGGGRNVRNRPASGQGPARYAVAIPGILGSVRSWGRHTLSRRVRAIAEGAALMGACGPREGTWRSHRGEPPGGGRARRTSCQVAHALPHTRERAAGPLHPDVQGGQPSPCDALWTTVRGRPGRTSPAAPRRRRGITGFPKASCRQAEARRAPSPVETSCREPSQQGWGWHAAPRGGGSAIPH
jgi:hypothetical protein